MAWVELYVFFAYILRKLDMELVETRYVTLDAFANATAQYDTHQCR